MNRLVASTNRWRGGAVVGALLLAVGLVGPAKAANTNLTANAIYSASSAWQDDQGNTQFVAAKAFDGDLATRWNSRSDDADGAWLAVEWAQPVTLNKVVIYERFSRVLSF